MKNEKPVRSTTAFSAKLKSTDIRQNDIKKPAINSVPLTRRSGATMDIARNNNIKHFAPNIINKLSQTASDIKHISHPMAVKANQIRRSMADMHNKNNQPMSLQEIKQKAINDAMVKTTNPPTKKSFFKKDKIINIYTISALAILIISAIVYFYMPAISVRVASAQSGVNATLPTYNPEGYSTDGPAISSNNEVAVNFKSNNTDNKFTLKQTKSSWNSSAVRNKISKDSGGEFITTEEKGLTIFTYKGNAAWVNGGILYTINGNAPLSSDQIRRIATSL